MPLKPLEEQTRTIVQQFLQFLGQRNLDRLISLFDSQVDWFIPGNQKLVPWTGKRETKQNIKAFFELLWENTEPISADIDHFLIENKIAVITGSFSTRMLQTGNIVDSPFSIFMKVEDGLIIKYRLLEDSYAVYAALVE